MRKTDDRYSGCMAWPNTHRPTHIASEYRSFFVFEEAYLHNPNRPVLSQSFLSGSGEIIPETRIFKTKLPPFFSNLLPDGHLRTYLAGRGGIKPSRELKLLELFGEDLPGAVTVSPYDRNIISQKPSTDEQKQTPFDQPYRFSLADVQLKFSVLAKVQAAESFRQATLERKPLKEHLKNGLCTNWIISFLQRFEHVWIRTPLQTRPTSRG